MKKYLLTSMIAMMVAAPAFADDDPYTNSNTYTGYCEIAHIGGTGTGSVNATANFNPKSYSCAAGTYLPAGNTWSGLDDGCATCEAGYYCGGGTYQYRESGDQGAYSCDDEYTGTTSAAGATSTEACYWANVACPTISGTTACDPHAATCAYTSQTTSGTFYPDTGPYTGNCAMDFTCATGYTKSTTQTTPTLPQTSQDGSSSEYHSHDNNNVSSNGSSMAAGSWSVTWTSGTTTGTMGGIASCNNVPGDTDGYAYTTPSILPANSNLASTSTTGRYCWCKPTTWTPSGGSTTNLSAAWVFRNDREDAGSCAYDCALGCADYVQSHSGFRGALFGLIGASAQCIANTITINWGGYGTGNNQSQQTQCTYGGDVTTPTQAPSKRGHTFDGWTFTLN